MIQIKYFLSLKIFHSKFKIGEHIGLEGAVKLGFKKELEAETDPKKKQALYEKLVKAAYDKGKAISAATFLEFDEVIDPKDTRQWIVAALQSMPKSSCIGSNRMVDG